MLAKEIRTRRKERKKEKEKINSRFSYSLPYSLPTDTIESIWLYHDSPTLTHSCVVVFPPSLEQLDPNRFNQPLECLVLSTNLYHKQISSSPVSKQPSDALPLPLREKGRKVKQGTSTSGFPASNHTPSHSHTKTQTD